MTGSDPKRTNGNKFNDRSRKSLHRLPIGADKAAQPADNNSRAIISQLDGITDLASTRGIGGRREKLLEVGMRFPGYSGGRKESM